MSHGLRALLLLAVLGAVPRAPARADDAPGAGGARGADEAGGATGADDLVEPDCLEARTCRPVLFVRPADCSPKKRWYYERRTQRCEAEDRLVLFLGAAGEIQGAQLLGPQPAGEGPVPNEVKDLWRHCGELADAPWDPLPTHLVRSVDPDLGRCLVAWPAALELSPEVEKRARVRGLDGLHPYVRAAGRELVRRAWEEGIEIKVISGYRHFKARVGYDRTLKRRRVLASWHAFGAALDINMMWAKGLGEAARRRRDDPEEHARWERLGEIARSLGLRWGGNMNSDDIFHLEWHPGYGGRLQPRELQAFLKLTGSRGQEYERSWRMFEPGAKAIVAATKLPPPPKKGAAKKGGGKKGAAKKGAAKKGGGKKAGAKKGAAKKGGGKKGAAKKGGGKKAGPKKGAAKKGSAKKGSSKKGSANMGSSKKGSSKKGSSKKGSSKKGSAK